MSCPKCGCEYIHGFCGCSTPDQKIKKKSQAGKVIKSDIPQWKRDRRTGNRLKKKTRKLIRGSK